MELRYYLTERRNRILLDGTITRRKELMIDCSEECVKVEGTRSRYRRYVTERDQKGIGFGKCLSKRGMSI